MGGVPEKLMSESKESGSMSRCWAVGVHPEVVIPAGSKDTVVDNGPPKPRPELGKKDEWKEEKSCCGYCFSEGVSGDCLATDYANIATNEANDCTALCSDYSLAPASLSNSTISLWPPSFAHFNAVPPPEVRISVSACALSSDLTVSR